MASNSTPFDLMVAPATLYYAPVGETFPDLSETPGANWQMLGTSGAKSYADDGVTVRANTSANLIRTLGTVAVRKATISERGFQVEVLVLDATAEVMALGFGLDPDEDITDTAAAGGAVGYRKLELPTSPLPDQFSVLVRADVSPYMADGKSQFEITAAIQTASVEPVYHKTNPFGVRFLWEAIDTDDGFVAYLAQDEAASGS